MATQNEPKIFLIGIQARSTSKRLPNKSLMLVDGKSIVEHVISSARIAANYMSRQFENYQANVKTWLLVPKGDPLAKKYQRLVSVYEGDENDVLSRYVKAANIEKADYIVRITGDCLTLPSFMISRAIKAAVKMKLDMTTNCIVRTHMEGWDVEIISRRLLDYLDANAEGEDREHVTTLVKKDLGKFPFFHKGKPSICHLLDDYDLSFLKTSIDTKEEYDKAVIRAEEMKAKKRLAEDSGHPWFLVKS